MKFSQELMHEPDRGSPPFAPTVLAIDKRISRPKKKKKKIERRLQLHSRPWKSTPLAYLDNRRPRPERPLESTITAKLWEVFAQKLDPRDNIRSSATVRCRFDLITYITRRGDKGLPKTGVNGDLRHGLGCQ